MVLADGAVANLRPVRAGDVDEMIEFYQGVSEESKYLRFFGTHPDLSEDDLEHWLHVDHDERVTLVLTEKEKIIGTARYETVEQLKPAKVGDVSFLVQDAHQGRGVANVLLEHLAHIGRENHVERFFAEMLTQNRSMVQVFKRAGYNVAPELEDGFIVVDFPIDPTAKSREVMLAREHKSEAAAIRRIIEPRSIAVIGAVETMQHIITAIVGGEYAGTLRMITLGAHADTHTAAEALDSIAEDVDLVLVQYEPDTLDEILAATARKNARGVVVLARGQNPILTAEANTNFVAAARTHGVRALGPASLGMINTAPTISLNATAVPMPRRGHVGLFTQSAGVAALALTRASKSHCGLSNFFATGSFADVTANDVIQFWSDDEHTHICLLSLDAIGNPRKFFRVLRRLALEKPVVIFTPSRALRSARYHDGHDLPTATAGALDEVIGDAGAMVVSQRDTMYNIAQILARQPVPQGTRVHVVSNSAGLNEQMMAAARRFGLTPAFTTVGGDPAAGVLKRTEEVLTSGEADAVLCAIVEISDPVFDAVHLSLENLARPTTIPLLGVFVGFSDLPTPPEGEETQGQLPIFDAYAEALEALSLIVHNEHRRSLARPHPDDETYTGDTHAARAFVDGILADSPQGRWLSDEECVDLLRSYDIPVTPWQPVANLDEAVAAAERFGWDVVLKATSPIVRGRPELATIIRAIETPEAMARAWRVLNKAATALLPEEHAADALSHLGLTVQPEVPAGSSWTIKAIEDPVLGPMISCGAAGMASDLLGDISWRVPPIRRSDAGGMLHKLGAAPLLTGYRGTRSADIAGMESILMRLGQLKDDLPSIVEVELTPVIAAADTTNVVGARIRIAPISAQRDPLARNIERG
ncbi:CoA-binding protein [Corynebacterium aquilae DSM 44791]|uniref:CoA-binding protein n=1 Tax=Corynebacterium aquilae DSM 44791 TaxID=1431546 RepID=A0A1L7CI27_9CORY|nr:CoA-binding protein [Corynebacterium aquilae DSM 44791]